jgi:hypothetical protein
MDDKMDKQMVLMSTGLVKPHISGCISSILIFLIPR